MSKELCKLDIALAIDEFEEENVDKNLRLLVQDYYQYYRTEIEHAKKVKDTTKMKLAVHTLKSTSRYLCCEYFALKCQNIEDIVKHTWDQIDKIYEEFIQCYEWFYEDAREKYETMQKEKEEKVEPKVEVKQEVVEKAKDVEVKGSDVSIKLIETKGSNSSIHSLKILKRNSTIKEESDEAEEPICRKTEESKNLDINAIKTPNRKRSNYSLSKQVSMTNEEFKNIFNISPNDIKIKSNDIDLKLRNNLKDLINEKMSNLISELKKNIANLNKDDLLKFLEDLRLITSNCRFDKLSITIVDIKNSVSNINNIDEINLAYDDVAPILNTMNAEANKIIQDFRDKIDEDGLNRLFPKNKNIEAMKISITRENSTTNSPLIKKNFNEMKSSDDSIFAELKPVKFDGLYKIEMTPEKIEMEIEKFTKEEAVSPKAKRETRKKLINDNAYPFKQDTKCVIF